MNIFELFKWTAVYLSYRSRKKPGGGKRKKNMNSISVEKIITLKNKKGKEIELVAEKVEKCTDENCSCNGSWGYVSYQDEIEALKKQGFVIQDTREETW